MKPTKKLYYQDAYKKTFQATVLECVKEKNSFAVLLDQTIFYPGGGGQPNDVGLLAMQEVSSVYEKDGKIWHIVPQPVEVSAVVTGHIDWQRRFHFMQNHSGEHIVSGIIAKNYKYNNVGFHMNSQQVVADYNQPLSAAELEEIEAVANRCIYENIRVQDGIYPPKEALLQNFRSKKDFTEDIRLVAIDGYDRCACCGLHVKQTGEIGLIKITHTEKYKGGIRIYLLCGQVGFQDYQKKSAIVNTLCNHYSTNADGILHTINKYSQEYDHMKQQLVLLKSEYYRWKADHYAALNNQMACIFENISKDDLKYLSLELNKKIEFVAVFSERDENEYQYILNSKKYDVQVLGKELNHIFNGKGGGSKELVQGILQGRKEEIQQHIIDSYIKISRVYQNI